jgi:hypothetical protein
LRKGERSSILDPKLLALKKVGEEEELEPIDIDVANQQQFELQEETEEVLQEMAAKERGPKDTSIETCQEYLQEVRIEVIFLKQLLIVTMCLCRSVAEERVDLSKLFSNLAFYFK